MMDTSDEAIEAAANHLYGDTWEGSRTWLAADMLLTMRTKFNALRDYTNGLEARAEAADKSEWDRLRTQDIMTLGALVHDENGVAWKARAEAAEKALQAMLRHSGVSDMAPEDKFPEDIEAESQAYAALKAKP